MLYSDDTIIDSTIGRDMDSTSGRTGLVFIKFCCMGFPLLPLWLRPGGRASKKAIFPLFESETGKNIAFASAILIHAGAVVKGCGASFSFP